MITDYDPTLRKDCGNIGGVHQIVVAKCAVPIWHAFDSAGGRNGPSIASYVAVYEQRVCCHDRGACQLRFSGDTEAHKGWRNRETSHLHCRARYRKAQKVRRITRVVTSLYVCDVVEVLPSELFEQPGIAGLVRSVEDEWVSTEFVFPLD